MKKALFADFESKTAVAWEAKLIADLRGKPYEELLWNQQGLTGKPFYTDEDLPGQLPNLHKVNPQPEIYGSRYWTNYQALTVTNEKESNALALHALNNGADGLLFEIEEMPNLENLLKGIEPAYCHISFSSKQLSTTSLFELYLEHLKKRSAELSRVNGFIDAVGPHFQNLITSLKTCFISPSNSTDAIPLNLALQLAKIVDLFDGPEVDLSKAFEGLCIRTDLGNDYFAEIARHRALSVCIKQLAQAYNAQAGNFKIISMSPDWSKEIESPHSFMLHATTQAMSAIIGGTDGLIIRPFYHVFEENRPLAERMARNISSVLKEEAYLDKNTDPAAGSYYIESLTANIVKNAMNLLKEIETMGGLSKIDLESFVTTKTTVQ